MGRTPASILKSNNFQVVKVPEEDGFCAQDKPEVYRKDFRGSSNEPKIGVEVWFVANICGEFAQCHQTIPVKSTISLPSGIGELLG
jgi:hypothetical protein